MVFHKENFLCLLLLIVLKSVESEEPFKSVPVTLKAYENDTAMLPCYIEGMERDPSHRVRWYRNKTLIGDSSDAHLLLPDRVRMFANSTLQIVELKPGDTADYTCEIVRANMNPLKQTHNIQVQYAPMVTTIPVDGYQEVKKGGMVDIGCEARGVPTPTLRWRKNGEAMKLLHHHSRLRFRAEQRHLAGVYECVADNAVGDPVIGNIRVVVHDAPEVTTSRSRVHAGVGGRAVLGAELHYAAPPARTSWYKEGRPVSTDDRVLIMVQDNLHQLIIRHVRVTDFGNYTFRAENTLGMADVSFKLTGVPDVPHFKIDPAKNKATPTSFTLIWEVDSYTPIIEYTLWLRPYTAQSTDPEVPTTENPNMWRKIVIPGDAGEGPIHTARYTVRGLAPGGVYAARLGARGTRGWGPLSPILHFATDTPAYHIKSSTVDYSELETPILEEEPEVTQNEHYPPEQDHLTTDSAGRENAAAILIVTLLFLRRLL